MKLLQQLKVILLKTNLGKRFVETIAPFAVGGSLVCLCSNHAVAAGIEISSRYLC